MMKRHILLAAAAILLLSCSGEPFAPGVDGPDFAVSDGEHAGNPHFFFLPPLVRAPSFGGDFDPAARPSVVICQLDGDACGPVVASFDPSEVKLVGADGDDDDNDEGDDEDDDGEDEEDDDDEDEPHFQVNWRTGKRNGVMKGRQYRIQVFLGTALLGFRDVEPRRGRVRGNPKDADFFPFRNGRTIPIKFRVEVGAACQGLDFDDVLGECTVGDLEDGITVQIPETGTGVVIPPQENQSGTVAVIIEPCRDANGGPVDLPVDIPLFGGCFEVRTEPEITQPLFPLASVFICEDLGIADHRVEELVTLHKTETLGGGDPVFALPHAPDLCPTELGQHDGSLLMRLARRVSGVVASAVGLPRPLVANTVLDRGAGGLSSGFSFFQFGLPSRMVILEGDNQTAAPGTAVAVDPAVLVTDADDEPVTGATVHYEVVAGDGSVSPMSVTTGADGVARVTEWVLGAPGANTLRASGRGIADPVTNGPADGFDPFVPVRETDPFTEVPAQLATGELLFNAEACGDGGGVVVDAAVEGAWQCAIVDETVTVPLGGGDDVTVRVRLLNDGDNLYGLATFDRGGAFQRLSVILEFDEDGDGTVNLREDVLWAKVTFQSPFEFVDMFSLETCAPTDVPCAQLDVLDGGTADGSGAFSDSPQWVIELAHPLASADTAHDLELAAGGTVHLVITVEIGATTVRVPAEGFLTVPTVAVP